MEITFDYHTHTTYSHGKGSILENAIAAKEKGLKGIAISDHGFSHPAFGMRRKYLQEMKDKCIEAEKITGINVKLGIESNLLGESGKTDVEERDYNLLDVYLVGVHRCIYFESGKDWVNLFARNFFISGLMLKPSQSLVDLTTRAYINAIKNNPIDAITHINYLCYSDAKEVAKCCADYGTLLEINTKKVHLSDSVWEQVLQTDVNFIINSDAHSPDRIGDNVLANELLSRVNIPENRILNVNGKIPTMRFEQYKKSKI